MPTNRKYRLKGRKAASVATPGLIATLAWDGDLDTLVRMETRLGNEPFDVLPETKEGVAKGIRILKSLWPRHRAAATEYCIRRCGPGVRPTLWWSRRARPFVKPRDWLDVKDGARFDCERRAADLEYLREHGHLTKEEKLKLDEMENGRRYGPESDS